MASEEGRYGRREKVTTPCNSEEGAQTKGGDVLTAKKGGKGKV